MFTQCAEGHLHWGRHGAAGLLLLHAGRVLLQRRSRLVHHGGTWSIPGGALDPFEAPTVAALREASEEAGIHRDDVELLGRHTARCGGWTYTTILARPCRPLWLARNAESTALRWVPVDDVEALPLHPGFAASWSNGLVDLARRALDR